MEKNNLNKTKKKYRFIKETLFFPKEKILVVGDLHLGYDFMLRDSGFLIPSKQIKNVIQRLNAIFQQIEGNAESVEKVIFLGDLKHSFGFEFKERNDFDEVMDFLRSRIEDENIILIKGNHDTMDYSRNKRMKPYHLEKTASGKGKICFAHGHKSYPKIFDKEIKTLVLGHLHPSVMLEENPGIKRETYKCFLTGRYRRKEVIFLPSFLGIIEGSAINQDYNRKRNEKEFTIIPNKKISQFKVHIVGEDKTYSFGRVKDL